MPRSLRPAIALALGLVGCSAEPDLGAPAIPDDTSGSSSGDGSGDTATPAADTTPSGPPVVVDIGKDVAILTEGGAIVVTATVRDPDGDADVAGGWLVLADTDVDVAPFQRGENGRFTASISWADLQRLDPPTFIATSPLRVLGRFTDLAGAIAERETSVLLVCAGLSGAACEGTCVDLESHREHCGDCGVACEGACVHGVCEPPR